MISNSDILQIIHISDTHIGSSEKEKPNRLLRCKSYLEKHDSKISSVILTGDLTDSGYDGKVTCGCLMPLIGKNNSITGGSKQNQLSRFNENVYEYLKSKNNSYSIYMVNGNHDIYNGAGLLRTPPMINYIKNIYGNTYYLKKLNGVYIFMLDIYPNKEICKWLQEKIIQYSLEYNRSPCIFAFHYNIKGAYSDWWSYNEKSIFYNIIKKLNTLCILVGHHHDTYTYSWMNIKVVVSAGNYFSVIKYNMKDNKLEIDHL